MADDLIDRFAARWDLDAAMLRDPPADYLSYPLTGGAGCEIQSYRGEVQAIRLRYNGRWGNYVYQLMNIFHLAEVFGTKQVYVVKNTEFPVEETLINGITVFANTREVDPHLYCLDGVFFSMSPFGRIMQELTPERRAYLANTYIKPLLAPLPRPGEVIGDEDLMIHIRAGDIFQGEDGDGGANTGGNLYTQPPLSFYLLAADRVFEGRQGSIIIIAQDCLNPVIVPLFRALSKADHKVTLRVNYDLSTDLAWLLAGRQAVFANGSIGIAVALLSPVLRRGFFFRHNGTGTLAPVDSYIGEQIKKYFVTDPADSYIAFGAWRNTAAQRQEMVRFPFYHLQWADGWPINEGRIRQLSIQDTEGTSRMRALQIMSTLQHKVEGIVHVGAGAGEECQEYRQSGAAACLYIESDPVLFAVLEKNIAEIPGHFAIRAVCAEAGGRTLTLKGEKLLTRTLDEIVSNEASRYPFNLLIVEVGGTDLNVLRGAQRFLERIDGIFIFVSEVALHENGGTVSEVTSFLRGFDFHIKWMEIGRLRSGHAFYARDGARPLPAAPSRNLALGRPAIQSSFSAWSNPKDETDALGGNNGQRTGIYGFHTEIEDNPWWQVDLGQAQPVQEVRVYNRLDGGNGERTLSLRVFLSRDGFTWALVHDQAGRWFGGIDGRPLRVFPEGMEARFVRLQLAARQYLHLDEVEVY